MRTRTRKILSLLLATAMVFTMNTAAFAVEIIDDEAAVESVEVDEAEVADIEEAEISAAEEVAELQATNKTGWSATVSDGNYEGGDKASLKDNGAFLSDTELLLSDNAVTGLSGRTDSKPLSVSFGSLWTGTKPYLANLKVDRCLDLENADSSVTVTFKASSNGDDFSYIHYTSGNKIVSVPKGYGDDAKKAFAAFAKASCGSYVICSTSVDGTNHVATITFSIDKADLQENNNAYGNGKTDLSSTLTGAEMKYYDHMPYFGNLKNADLVSKLGISLSGNGTTFELKKVKLKHKKSWGNKARIYVTKITGGTKKENRKLKKAINKAHADIEVYPYNLDNGSDATVKKVKKKKSGTVKYAKIRIGKKTTTLKNGKSDKWGGTVAFNNPSGNTITISSNLFEGTVAK